MWIKSKEKGLFIALEVLSVVPLVGLPFAMIALFLSFLFLILHRLKPESFLLIGHYIRCFFLSIAGITISVSFLIWGLHEAILIREEGKLLETETTCINIAKSVDSFIKEHPEFRSYNEIPILKDRQLKDGWGHPFWIKTTKDSYQVLSLGPIDANKGDLKKMKSSIYIYLHDGILETHAPFKSW